MSNYQWKTKPYEHQETALKNSCFSEYYALYMEMGTGKSKVVVDTMALLFEAGHIDTVLILAPKGVYDNWIRSEIPDTCQIGSHTIWSVGKTILQKNLLLICKILYIPKSEKQTPCTS